LRFRLDGRTALITGGSRGIGLGIARAMAAAGADIALVSRAQSTLDEAAAELAPAGRKIRTYPFDLQHVGGIADLFERVVAETGAVDILVNNAGTTVRGPAETLSPAEWRTIVETNLSAVFALCQAFARERIDSGLPGKIVNIGSVMSEVSRPGGAAYATAKGGIRQMTRALAVEWAAHGILVNSIGPGFTRTDLTAGLWQDAAFAASVARRTPLGRWGTPEDIGAAAVFLASPAADFITGQTLFIDGGLTCSMGVFT
jgi:gluconate 5-dehydrogenase